MLDPQRRITQSTVRLSAQRPVRVQEIPEIQRTITPHDHDYFELTIVTGGAAMHRTARGDRPLRRGTVLVLAPEEVHGYQLEERDRVQLWNVYYLSEWLMADLPFLWGEPHLVDLFLGKTLFPRREREGIPEFDLSEEALTGVIAELTALQVELERESPSLIYLKSVLLKFLVQLSRGFGAAGGGVTYAFREEVWGFIHRVDRLLKRGEPLNLQEEAQRLRMTRDHLGRLFREATGQTPIEYYQARRLQEASVRLLDSRLSLTEIAHALCFADSAHFSRAFRQGRGLSPRQYRELYL